MNFSRRLEPEWLDQMPPDDPRAIRARRDLRRVNAFMGNARCMASDLKMHAVDRRPCTIVDLGSGDGQFMLQVARRLAAQWQNVRVILQDRQDIVSNATRDDFAALNWSVETVCADVFEFLADARSTGVDVITSNLFLHHFTDAQLARLLEEAAQLAWLVVVCEPRRAKIVVRASRLLWAVGCSGVSIHDAVVSARAGFTDRELSALWPTQEQWQLHEGPIALFTHRFSARRSGSATESTLKRPGSEA
jgi:hypothetical protein